MAAPTKVQQRQQGIERLLHTCVHFRGIHQRCGEDIDVRALVGGPDFGWARRIPCTPPIDPSDVVMECSARRFYTREEAERREDKTAAIVERVVGAARAAHAHAEKQGLGKGHGGTGVMDCPAGCGGELRYSVAALNGHMHAACTTDGCLRWME